MKYKFSRVVDGIVQYIHEELFCHMNDAQEFAARVLVGRIVNNQDLIKEFLVGNGFIRTFAIIDGDGMVDVYSIMRDVKTEIARKEKITFSVPLFGNLTFQESDVEALYHHITGEEYPNESY